MLTYWPLTGNRNATGAGACRLAQVPGPGPLDLTQAEMAPSGRGRRRWRVARETVAARQGVGGVAEILGGVTFKVAGQRPAFAASAGASSPTAGADARSARAPSRGGTGRAVVAAGASSRTT